MIAIAVRRVVPQALLPLAIIASALAATPWLRSFSPGVMSAPLYGAAVLSVVVPPLAVALGARRIWLSLLVDVLAFVVYTLLVVLRNPTGFGDLVTGIVHGPSLILTFALPLVSPRTLLVAPIALTWLGGALAGECLTRRWFTVLPYPALLVSFGLAFAGTQRAVQTGAAVSTQNELGLAAVLLGVLLLMRVAQTWVRLDETAESTQADGILPLRSLGVGAVAAVVVALVAGLVAQAAPFGGQGKAPQRVPSVDQSRPLTPLAFVASLRPADPKAPGEPLFTVQTNRAVPGYFAIANVDSYDGEGWSFARTFRPSGGVLPEDTDPALKSIGVVATQEYTIGPGALAGVPWMPYLYRAQSVSGASVNIDPSSGMIVPSGQLQRGDQYRVRSQVSATTFDKLGRTAVADTGTAAQNTTLPPTIRQYLSDAIAAFSDETGVPATPALPFLQALQHDLQTRYSLTGTGASNPTSPAPTVSAPRTTPGRANTPGAHRLVQLPGLATTTPAAPASSTGPRQGTTALSDVLASIVLGAHTGTPEQYATLVALIARQLGVPARVATGFRVLPHSGGPDLPSGRYQVTTQDAWTWVEIPVAGRGWVVLDAAPSTVSTAQRSNSATARPSASPSPTPTQNALITKSNQGHAVAPKSKVHTHAGASHSTLVLALIVAAAALLLALLSVLSSRKQLRRRRRQRDPDPRTRAIGAWQESIDVMTEAGLPDLSSLTSAEIAALAGAEFGAEPAARVGHIGSTANAAVYSTALLVGPQEAAAAWQAERELRRDINRQLGIRGRLAAWLRYHRTPRGVRRPGPESWAAEASVRQAEPQHRRRHRAH